MKARLIYICLLLGSVCHAQPQTTDSVLPKSVIIDQRLAYDKYTQYLIPSINWLQQTPLTKDPAERKRLDNFLMAWIQKNNTITVTLPEYLVKFQNASNEMYFLYFAGWIKYALQTKDPDRTSCFLAGVRSVIDYYGNNNGVKQNDYMDHLLELERHGKLESLYDTSGHTQNTYLFLKGPSKHNFRYNENFISFKYTAINFIDPKALNYRYKLQGYYENWIPANDESVIFPKLPSGNYLFRIQVSLDSGFNHVVERSFPFTIATPVWFQPWFLILGGLLIVGLVVIYIRQREINLKKVASLQHEKMIFEYDNLRSQINPHFLFNSINTLTSLIEEDPEKAVEYSDHLSDLYRNVLAYRTRDLVFVYEELDILSNYLHIQKSRFGNALKITIDIPEELKKTKKILPLALQLLVENAMKHNIVSASKQLRINIKATADYLTVSNNIQYKMSKEKGVGLGLENIQKRYAISTDRPFVYGPQGDEYVVTLPLL